MRKAIAEREQRIFYQTMHDSLTDLPNREKIIRQLAMLIEKGPHAHVAVLSIRLSRMNEISSTLGHKASDELIKLAAKQLGGTIGADALLGRTGSNEFVIAIGINDPDEATRHAEQIGNSLGNGVLLESVSIALQTGIGVAIYPEHGSSASALLGNAMIAQSEAQFRDEPVAVYESGREEYYIRQLRIVNDLRSAIQKDQLFVCYQPKVSLETGLVCGAEALVRWEHPEYGYLPPDEFIPAAEEAGTIQYLTRYVMERAIKECRKWQDAGHSLQVSVNISARDLLDEYLPYFILQLLSEHKLPAERLTLEVTENMIMRKLQKAISVLDCLRDIGVKISMDDFGTGQSSLAQLKNIPLDELKVDKSFVMTLLSDTKNEAIVRTTLQLAENMDLAVVAEGVEDEATMNYLRTSRCQQVQGFYISKPIPDEEFLAWLDSRDSKVRIERRGPNRVFATKR
jgi:diguanylate cyclase (GGDEF)-like protein